MNHIRAFIAIEIPIGPKKELDQLINRLQIQMTARIVRWVPVGNIHITLKFLGEVDSPHLELLKQLLTEKAGEFDPFGLSIGGLGAFPSVAKPRAIWIGVQAPTALAVLQNKIEEAALQLGFPSDERPFSPHLTLARVNQNASFEEIRLVGNSLAGSLSPAINQTMGNFLVDQIHIFRSDLRPGGAVYTRIASAHLAGIGQMANGNIPGQS